MVVVAVAVTVWELEVGFGFGGHLSVLEFGYVNHSGFSCYNVQNKIK